MTPLRNIRKIKFIKTLESLKKFKWSEKFGPDSDHNMNKIIQG